MSAGTQSVSLLTVSSIVSTKATPYFSTRFEGLVGDSMGTSPEAASLEGKTVQAI